MKNIYDILVMMSLIKVIIGRMKVKKLKSKIDILKKITILVIEVIADNMRGNK